MKYFFSSILVALVLATSTTGCSVNSATVSNAENSLTQTAAYESAKATVNKWVSYLGITPAKAQQLLPTVQDYYTQAASVLKNTSGSTTTQKLSALKDSLAAKLKTSLTADQVAKALGYL
ncbi:MAG TPA: hypothetical protein VG603_16680 [Chitinophagales bacterium]|nr:hypothetical protein [Chitinophagales bacterium]